MDTVDINIKLGTLCNSSGTLPPVRFSHFEFTWIINRSVISVLLSFIDLVYLNNLNKYSGNIYKWGISKKMLQEIFTFKYFLLWSLQGYLLIIGISMPQFQICFQRRKKFKLDSIIQTQLKFIKLGFKREQI